MSAGKDKARSSGRVLDPIERASEILFGLIMVLSFTCTISIAEAGREELRSVVIGAIGCNLAWGIVDAVMYLMSLMIERARQQKIALAVRASADAEQGKRLLAEAMPEPFDELFEEQALEAARRKLVALPEGSKRPKLTGRDYRGALGVFLLVFISTFPVVVPFVCFSPLARAMRISNGVAIVMLYAAGHMLALHAGLRPARTGWAMVAVGVVLVGITIALGG